MKKSEKATEWDNPAAVNELLATTTHPLSTTVEAIRATILAVDQNISEGVKWNSPSFYLNGWFATMNLRDPKVVVVVLHLGAKVKDNSSGGVQIDDPSKILDWAAKERALARFRSLEEFNSNADAFRSIVAQWAALMN